MIGASRFLWRPIISLSWAILFGVYAVVQIFIWPQKQNKTPAQTQTQHPAFSSHIWGFVFFFPMHASDRRIGSFGDLLGNTIIWRVKRREQKHCGFLGAFFFSYFFFSFWFGRMGVEKGWGKTNDKKGSVVRLYKTSVCVAPLRWHFREFCVFFWFLSTHFSDAICEN